MNCSNLKPKSLSKNIIYNLCGGEVYDLSKLNFEELKNLHNCIINKAEEHKNNKECLLVINETLTRIREALNKINQKLIPELHFE